MVCSPMHFEKHTSPACAFCLWGRPLLSSPSVSGAVVSVQLPAGSGRVARALVAVVRPPACRRTGTPWSRGDRLRADVDRFCAHDNGRSASAGVPARVAVEASGPQWSLLQECSNRLRVRRLARMRALHRGPFAGGSAVIVAARLRHSGARANACGQWAGILRARGCCPTYGLPTGRNFLVARRQTSRGRSHLLSSRLWAPRFRSSAEQVGGGASGALWSLVQERSNRLQRNAAPCKGTRLVKVHNKEKSIWKTKKFRFRSTMKNENIKKSEDGLHPQRGGKPLSRERTKNEPPWSGDDAAV